jgi:ATP-binding cassette subfamily F protein uup
VISYLGDFLFPPQRCRQPVNALSGGERNRLLLAKLFTRPANVLVLDEPTNDLDLETLELLEELLLDFDGTLLLVSHDRAFLDNVVTSTLVFEGDGRVRQYVGGYADWVRQRPPVPAVSPVAPRKAANSGQTATPPEKKAKAKKLSYKDQRELQQLPARIEALEQELEQLQQQLSDPEVFKQQGAEGLQALGERLKQAEAELELAFDRWAELEEE